MAVYIFSLYSENMVSLMYTEKGMYCVLNRLTLSMLYIALTFRNLFLFFLFAPQVERKR